MRLKYKAVQRFLLEFRRSWKLEIETLRYNQINNPGFTRSWRLCAQNSKLSSSEVTTGLYAKSADFFVVSHQSLPVMLSLPSWAAHQVDGAACRNGTSYFSQDKNFIAHDFISPLNNVYVHIVSSFPFDQSVIKSFKCNHRSGVVKKIIFDIESFQNT